MKFAQCVFPVYVNDIRTAMSRMKEYILQAAEQRCDLILFPEACLSGLDLTGFFDTDRELGLDLNSAVLHQIRETAAKARIHVAFGWLEATDDALYDSAMLIDDKGRDLLHYRRISEGWLVPQADRNVYRCGTAMMMTNSAFGKVSMLLCGDLFHPDITQSLIKAQPDLLLYPFARGFKAQPDMQSVWDQEELPEYIGEWNKYGGLVLATNAVDISKPEQDSVYCGGAWVLHPEKGVLAAKPLMGEGLLIYSQTKDKR